MAKQSNHSFGITFHDYNRTIIGYHGTTSEIAERLVNGEPFTASSNNDDWFGTGIYFWEYAPKQAWWWAENFKKNTEPAVVGAVIRLGHCLDLLDPLNVKILQEFHNKTLETWNSLGEPIPKNGNQHKNLDCAVFNLFYNEAHTRPIETARAVYVPTQSNKRAWPRSWIYEQAHIQICIRNPENIIAVWHVRKDGRYGKDQNHA